MRATGDGVILPTSPVATWHTRHERYAGCPFVQGFLRCPNILDNHTHSPVTDQSPQVIKPVQLPLPEFFIHVTYGEDKIGTSGRGHQAPQNKQTNTKR